jgi:flagellar biogenesis protein FliO
MLEAWRVLNVVLALTGVLTIVLVATGFLVHRLRKSDKPSKSFFTWLKHIVEGVMGL